MRDALTRSGGLNSIKISQARRLGKRGHTRVCLCTALLALVARGSNMRGVLGFTGSGWSGLMKPVYRAKQSWTPPTTITGRTTRFKSSVTPGASTPTSLNSTQQPTTTTTTTTTSSLLDSLNVIERLCDLELPEGRCVGLRLLQMEEGHPDSLDPAIVAENPNHWIHSLLHPQEAAFGLEQATAARRETFFVGRIAVREALGIWRDPTDATSNWLGKTHHHHHKTNDWNCGIPAILKDEYGRPKMPKGYLGSISHKGRAGVGIVARDETFSSPDDPPKVGIGIDLERTTMNRRNIAPRVLTENEIASLGRVKGVTEEEEVMLRFSLKECIYKSVHPLICQYVGFQEAEVTPYSDGTAIVSWKLKSGADLRLGEVMAHWQRLEGGEYFLSTSSAFLLDEAKDHRTAP